MFKDKYPSIFSPQMEAILNCLCLAIVFIILHMFSAMGAVLKIEEYFQIFPSISWGIFGHAACFDQSLDQFLQLIAGRLSSRTSLRLHVKSARTNLPSSVILDPVHSFKRLKMLFL